MATYTNIPDSVTSLNLASYVNIPSAYSFSPSDVTGLELWLDGRDLVGADGTAISSWTPRAGASGTDALQATGARQPLIKSGVNGLNSLAVARFDGTNDYMLSTFDAGSTGFTVYLVGRTGGALSAYGNVVGSGGGVTGLNPTPGIFWSFVYGSAVDGNGAGWAGPIGDVALGDVSGAAINTAFIHRYRTNKVAWSISGPNSGTPADTSFPTGTYQAHLGCAANVAGTPTSPFNGDIAAALFYSVAVSDANDALIIAYLQETWGL